MARYFNRTSGSVAVTLKRGGSVYVPAKSWMNIPLEDENSADLVRAVKSGFLVRYPDSASAAGEAGTSVKKQEG